MEMPAERIGERVHSSDRRVGEGHAGKHRAEQHVGAGAAILGRDAGLADVAAKQTQRFARQAVGKDILLVLRGVGLDRVHHRVDAGGSGDVGG